MPRASGAVGSVLLVAALVVAGTDGWAVSRDHDDPRPTTAPAAAERDVAARPTAAPTTGQPPVATTPVTTTPVAPPAATAVLAQAATLPVYASPGAPAARSALANPTSWGVPLVLLVVGARAGWWQVALPVRPNGSTGWVRAADVAVRSVPYQVTIAQHTRTALLWHDGTLLRRYPVAVGTAADPSPNGLFFVNVIIDNRGGDQAYGPWVLGLSGFSDVLLHFGSGNGPIAMHGTDAAASVGTAASHGCFRMRNADATALAHVVTLGTPVYVTD